MSNETLIQRAQIELVAIYKGFGDLTALSGRLPDQAVSKQANTILLQMRAAMDKLQVRMNEQDREHMQVRGLFSVGRAINSTLELDTLLSLVIETILNVTGAERAFLMLLEGEEQQLAIKVARGIDKSAQAGADFQISRSIAERVAREQTAVLTTNAQEDTRFQAQQSIINFSLRSILCVPLRVKRKTIGVIYADNRVKSGLFSARDRDILLAFADQAAVAIENARLFSETRQRLNELTVLQEVGEVLTRTLDLEVVLQTICREALRTITTANKVVIHLLDVSESELVARAIACRSEIVVRLRNFKRGQGLAGRALEERRTLNVPETNEESHFLDTGSGLRSLVVSPLVVGDRVLGTLTADSLQPNSFDERAVRLLNALADQAAIAIENTRLFGELRRNIAEVSALKGFQDNIFASIPSAVITIDMEDCITTFNRAAEQILNLSASDVVHHPIQEVLSVFGGSELPLLLDTLKQEDKPLIAQELRRDVPRRGPVSLSMSMSTLRDASAATRLGVAIVMDDLTEKKKLQAREEMFGRYLAPSVIKRLPDDPRELKLGGTRQTVSILFADIRGYSTYSERLTPELLVDILNQYLSLSAQAILAEEGTLDKFMGDAVMAFWNAPEEQPDHTLRAVRAAWRMRVAIVEHHQRVPLEQRLSFGVGLHTGPVVVGNIGTERALNYTAIGDAVNLAKRLQEGAAANQIVLSDAALQIVQDQVEVSALDAVQVKGRSAFEKRWELREVRM
jgi:adenylate cyclase